MLCCQDPQCCSGSCSWAQSSSGVSTEGTGRNLEHLEGSWKQSPQLHRSEREPETLQQSIAIRPESMQKVKRIWAAFPCSTHSHH